MTASSPKRSLQLTCKLLRQHNLSRNCECSGNLDPISPWRSHRFWCREPENLNLSPLTIYLDTSDYSHLFYEPPDGPAHQTLKQLLAFRDQGKVAIGYSWATIVEFITKPTSAYRDQRTRRGQLIKDICGRNAFPFLTDLKKGARFPNNGIWLEGQDGKMFTAKWWRSVSRKQYLSVLAEQQNLNRAQRRRLKTESGMRQLLKESAIAWGNKREDFAGIPVSDELIASGIFSRFSKGQCSDAEFEERVNRWLSDPAEFSRIYYDYAGKEDFKKEFMETSLDKVETCLQQLHQAICGMEDKRKALREELIRTGAETRRVREVMRAYKFEVLDSSSVVRSLEQEVGEGRANHIAHYMLKASRKNYQFSRSDLMDIIQMCYVQDCDLFRCDKKMADLYRDYKPFAGKLVSKFSDLPARIEERLCNCSE